MALETPAPKETRTLQRPRALSKLRTNDFLAGIELPVHRLAPILIALLCTKRNCLSANPSMSWWRYI